MFRIRGMHNALTLKKAKAKRGPNGSAGVVLFA
jgi:hypothetical protein